MPKVIFLVGLCGAGKTRKAKQMEEKGFVFVEGFEGNPANYQLMVDSLRAGRDCVAEELQTLSHQYRLSIAARLRHDTNIPGLPVEFWFFEPDIINATLNVIIRPEQKIRAHDLP